MGGSGDFALAEGRSFGLIPAHARRLDLALLALLAIAVFVVHAQAWPLFPGRDAQTYLMYYLEMGADKAVFPQLMLFRTPVAPLVFGLSIDLGGPLLAEIVMGAGYLIAILAVYCTGAFWSRRVGVGAALAILAYPGYGALYHNVSGDGPFAFGVCVWALLICATVAAPRTWKFALHGAVVFLLVMTRPSAVVLVPLFALFPLLLEGSRRKRLLRAAAFLVTAAALLIGWSAYNDIRYGDFTLSRMSAVQMPLYRTLALDRLVDPSNGPASRDLAEALESDLLRREPYRSYGIGLHDFLYTGRITMWTDLAGLSDRTWGWDSDYSKLRAVAWEAIRAHPLDFAGGVGKTVAELFVRSRFTPSAKSNPPPRRTIECELSCTGKGLVRVGDRVLPEPADKTEPIPRAHQYWLQSTPDNSIGSDWSSFAAPRFRFKDPEVKAHYERLKRDLREIMEELPSRSGSFVWAGRLNKGVERRLPPMLFWVLIGAVGLVWRPPRRARVLVFLCGVGVVSVVATALANPSAAQYRLPFDPLFVVFGVAGALGVLAALWERAVPAVRRRRAKGSLGA